MTTNHLNIGYHNGASSDISWELNYKHNIPTKAHGRYKVSIHHNEIHVLTGESPTLNQLPECSTYKVCCETSWECIIVKSWVEQRDFSTNCKSEIRKNIYNSVFTLRYTNSNLHLMSMYKGNQVHNLLSTRSNMVGAQQRYMTPSNRAESSNTLTQFIFSKRNEYKENNSSLKITS